MNKKIETLEQEISTLRAEVEANKAANRSMNRDIKTKEKELETARKISFAEEFAKRKGLPENAETFARLERGLKAPAESKPVPKLEHSSPVKPAGNVQKPAHGFAQTHSNNPPQNPPRPAERRGFLGR